MSIKEQVRFIKESNLFLFYKGASMSGYICPFKNTNCSPVCEYFIRTNTNSNSDVIPFEISIDDIVSAYTSDDENTNKFFYILTRFIPINSSSSIKRTVFIDGYCKLLHEKENTASINNTENQTP